MGVQNNRNFDLDTFRNNDADQLVIRIHICAYKNESNLGDEDGNPPTNHWTAFLELTGGVSVRLDMGGGYGSDGLRGKLEVASKRYISTNSAIKTISFPTQISVTVQQILVMINKNGRDSYQFTEEGEGCRYWIYVFISDLQSAGVIGSGSNEIAFSSLNQYWRNPTGSESRSMKKGSFR